MRHFGPLTIATTKARSRRIHFAVCLSKILLQRIDLGM
jgi:hypothetical protein